MYNVCKEHCARSPRCREGFVKMKSLPKILLAGLAIPFCLAAAPGPKYVVSGKLPAPDGGWDYASFDPSSGQLLVARGSSVSIIDPSKTHAVRHIGHLEHGHAAFAVAGNRILATSGADGKVVIIDRATGTQRAVTVGKDPDAALIEPGGHRAWIMVARSGAATEIDIDAATVLRSIPLKPGLEFPVLVGNTLYVNNEDTNEIERADLTKGEAIKPVALPGCMAPSGLGYDALSHQLVSACSNGKAAIVDIGTGRVTMLLTVGHGPDAVIMDQQHHLAFIPCGKDGVLDIIALAEGSARVVGLVTTQIGARTGAIDPRDGTLYLPTANFRKVKGHEQRSIQVPGSFHILVVKRAA